MTSAGATSRTSATAVTAKSRSPRSFFERALDALPDGVLLTDADRRVVYCNPAFARHWNIPVDIVASKDEMAMLRYVRSFLVDPDGFLRSVEEVNPSSEAPQDDIYLKDGRVLCRRSVPFEQDGAFAARLWIFTDVTEARNARVDTLCGVPNRSAYAIEFPTFVEAADDGLVRSVGILDVDNFKAYNDHYGHAAGDLVLRQIGALLRRKAQAADDLVFRIGGEEFLLACKTREVGDAVSFFESVRASVMDMQLTHVGNAPHRVVTASIGVGVFRAPQKPNELFNQVDAALYRAKREGRNRVSLADPAPMDASVWT